MEGVEAVDHVSLPVGVGKAAIEVLQQAVAVLELIEGETRDRQRDP